MYRKIAAIITAAFPAVAAEPVDLGEDAALNAAVEKYTRPPVTQAAIECLFSVDTMRTAAIVQLQILDGNLLGEETDLLGRVLRQELKRMHPQFERPVFNAAYRTHSWKEIKAMNDFIFTDADASAFGK